MVEGSRPTTRVAGSSSEMEENLRRERILSFQSAHILDLDHVWQYRRKYLPVSGGNVSFIHYTCNVWITSIQHRYRKNIEIE